ncbi:MAG: glycosyl transferase [Actinomycetales bacterium]|nr:MAG: glycosyl transferase [Actinomycetales bacterium]
MTETRRPLVSVVCAAYQRSSAIVPTVKSVLAQSFGDFELIVALDGCTDDTGHWVTSASQGDPRVRLLELPRFGHPAGPRNAAAKLAKGEYIAYVDHDDLWDVGHLAETVGLVKSGVDVAATALRTVDRHGRRTGGSADAAMCWHPMLQVLAPLFQPSVVVHRRDLVAQVGGWYHGPGLEDWDLWWRFAEAGASTATSLAVSATVMIDANTRRHRIPRPHVMPIARFATAAAAASALIELRQFAFSERAIEAVTADLYALYAYLVADRRFVWPQGWDERYPRTAAALVGALQASDSGVVTGWSDGLIVVPRQGSYIVAAPLWVARAQHALQVRRLTASAYPRLIAGLRAHCHRLGGTLALEPAWKPAGVKRTPLPVSPVDQRKGVRV